MSAPQKCGPGCVPLCDFCVFYDDDDARYGNVCAGWGLCLFNGKMVDLSWGDNCGDFICKNRAEREEARRRGKVLARAEKAEIAALQAEVDEALEYRRREREIAWEVKE